MMPDTASLWAAAKKFEGILRKDVAALSFAPLVDIYRRLGLLEESIEAARNGCRLHPDFAAGQMALAKSALEVGYKDEAVRALEAVVRVTPENLEAQRLLADLYAAEGKADAALHCLTVANSLDVELLETETPATFTEEVFAVEEIPDADILDLSEELIEDESFDDSTQQFAASPDRPSLGEAVNRSEPFLMETPPPLYVEDQPAATAAPALASATIAELYVSQGFPDKGADVYRELLSADPLNESFGKRLRELTQPEQQPPVEVEAVQSVGLLDKLQEWLGNIGRVRECRTRNL